MFAVETRGKRHPWVKLGEQRAKRLAVEHAVLLADELERNVRVVTYRPTFHVVAEVSPGMTERAVAALLAGRE